MEEATNHIRQTLTSTNFCRVQIYTGTPTPHALYILL